MGLGVGFLPCFFPAFSSMRSSSCMMVVWLVGWFSNSSYVPVMLCSPGMALHHLVCCGQMAPGHGSSSVSPGRVGDVHPGVACPHHRPPSPAPCPVCGPAGHLDKALWSPLVLIVFSSQHEAGVQPCSPH